MQFLHQTSNLKNKAQKTFDNNFRYGTVPPTLQSSSFSFIFARTICLNKFLKQSFHLFKTCLLILLLGLSLPIIAIYETSDNRKGNPRLKSLFFIILRFYYI